MIVSKTEKQNWSPKTIITEFRKLLEEAGKFYDKAPGEVTQAEFHFVSGGRVGRALILKVGGYSKLRNYVYPTIKGQPDQAAKALIEKILSR